MKRKRLSPQAKKDVKVAIKVLKLTLEAAIAK